jgi:adenosine/AMP kinase
MMESTAMSARFILIAAATLTIAGVAVAEPSKPEVQSASQPASRPVQVLMASADQVQARVGSVDQAAPAPVKRPRAARVTTCRCGDQQGQ